MSVKSWKTCLSVALGLLAASAAMADPGDGGYYGHYGMMGGGGWFYGPIMMVIFFGLLVGTVVLIIYLIGGPLRGNGPQDTDRAGAILRERLAKGEISTEEYETLKKILG